MCSQNRLNSEDCLVATRVSDARFTARTWALIVKPQVFCVHCSGPIVKIFLTNEIDTIHLNPESDHVMELELEKQEKII